MEWEGHPRPRIGPNRVLPQHLPVETREKSERKERDFGEIRLPEKVFRGRQESPTPSCGGEVQS